MPITHDMKDFNLAENTHKMVERPASIDVGAERQLLFDDFFIAMGKRPQQYPHGIRWVNAPVEKQGAPLFCGELPWETACDWVSVLRDEGRFRMWYNSEHESHQGLLVSYAESDDGLQFKRETQGLVESKGSTDNNIVFDGGLNGVSPEMGNVFIDPSAPEAERYKMIYTDWEGPHIFVQPFTHNVGVLRGAASPDGLRWKRYYDNFLGKYCDSQNSACWDAELERYVAYHRTSGSHGSLQVGDLKVDAERRGRAVGRLESRDYRNWESTGVALQADFQDGLNVDVYNSAYSRYPAAAHAHFLFPSFYHHYEGTFEVNVCTSRDNRSWSRPTRETFIPLGRGGEFDSFIISVAPGFVPIDDDHYALYYRSGDSPHGGASVKLSEGERKRSASRVGRVVLKRDRIVGIEAGPEGGHFCTRPLRIAGRSLRLNVEPTGPDAHLRVQLLSWEKEEPIEGYTFAACSPMTTDELDARVRWQGDDGIPPAVAEKPLRLHFEFANMRVYAFQFRAFQFGE